MTLVDDASCDLTWYRHLRTVMRRCARRSGAMFDSSNTSSSLTGQVGTGKLDELPRNQASRLVGGVRAILENSTVCQKSTTN